MYNLDITKLPQKPKLFLCKPNRTVIARLNESYEISLSLKLDGLNELSFKIPYEIERNNKLIANKSVKKIKQWYQVKMELGNFTKWFIIEPPSENSQDDSDFIIVKCLSLENELTKQYIRNYQVESKLLSDVATVALADTLWSIGVIPEEYLLTSSNPKYRSFNVSSKTRLEFIKEISETFDVVARFDTENRKVNFYTKDNLGVNKGLKITERKYLQTIVREENNEDFCTRLKVFGKNNLSIQRVNLTGQNYIENFSYFLFPFQRDLNKNVIEKSDYMSDELCHSILDYNDLLISKQGEFDQYLIDKESYESTLVTKEDQLFTLETELIVIEDNLEVAKQNGDDTTQLEADKSAKESEISTKQNEIESVKSQISNVNSSIATLRNTISIENNFTVEQIEERKQFIIEKEWSDQNYTDDKALYNTAFSKLDEMKIPPSIIKMDIINFLEVINEQTNWDKIVIGDTITVTHDKLSIDIKSMITEASFDFENREIQISVSNVRNTDVSKNRIINLLYKSESAAITLEINRDNWNNVGIETREYIDTQIKEVNTSLNTLQTDINRFSADGFLSNSESQLLKNTLKQVKSESTDLISVATLLEITTEKTNYQNALSDLETYLTTNWIDQLNYPINLLLSDRALIENKFEVVQNTKSILIDKISEVREVNAKSYTDDQIEEVNTSMTALESKLDDYSNDNKLTLSEANSLELSLEEFKQESGDLVNIATILNITTEKDNYATSISNLETELNTSWINQTTYPLDITTTQREAIKTKIGDVQNKKSILINKISEVREANSKSYTDTQISEVNSSLGDLQTDINAFSDDSKITLSEANSLETSLSQVNKESIDLINVANTLAITTEKTNYENTLSDLDSYLTNNWINQVNYPLNITSTDRATIKTKFESVQDTKSKLINKITDVQSQDGKVAYNETLKTIRNANPIPDPTIATDETAIDHTPNDDSTVDISFEWSYVEDSNSPISGFGVVVYSSSNSTTHTPSLSTDHVAYMDKASRSYILTGVSSNKYYTFGVFAFRAVDTSVNENGIIRSNIVRPSYPTENPYRPKSNVEFKGNIIGTIGGVPYDQINKGEKVIIGSYDTSANWEKADFIVPSGFNAQDKLYQAIDSLGSSGGIIQFMDGVYYFGTWMVEIPSNFIIRGLGNNTRFVLTSEWEDNHTYYESGTGLFSAFTNNDHTNGNENIYLENFQLVSDVTNPITSVNFIHFKNGGNFRVRNVKIERVRNGITMTNASDCIIENSITNDGKDGIHLSNVTKSRILNNSSNNNQDYGIYSYSDSMTDEDLNLFKENQANDNDIGLEVRNHLQSAIVNNRCFNNNNNISIIDNSKRNQILDNETKGGLYGLYLNNQSSFNIISNNSTRSSSFYGMMLKDGSSYNNIQNNIVSGNDKYGIYISSPSTSNSDCTNNLITNNDLNGAGTQGAIFDGGVNTVTIAGNRH